jgi:COP9 signalosome complex subunit 1
MAHRDLAEYYRAVGDYQAALKHYSKLREFCTTSQHVLDMCIAVLELLIENRSYAHIPTYVFKAEPALDASSNSLRSSTISSAHTAATPHAAATAAQATRERVAYERQKVQTKLEIATGISHLGTGAFEKAAGAFLRAGGAGSLGHWARKVRLSAFCMQNIMLNEA